MKKTKCTKAQIIGILHEQEQGLKVSDLSRKHGISDVTFCNRKSKYGGMALTKFMMYSVLCRLNVVIKTFKLTRLSIYLLITLAFLWAANLIRDQEAFDFVAFTTNRDSEREVID